jgi:peroxiredoxin
VNNLPSSIVTQVFAIVLSCLLTSLPALADLQRVGDFALLDHQGKFHKMSWYGDKELLVLFIQGNGCPIARNAVPALKALRDEFEPSGVAFFMLNPQPQDNRESINEEAARFDYDFPILIDDSQLVAETLGVDRTSETFVIDPKTMTVLFRGPIDDRLGYETQKPEASAHYLRDALRASLAGDPVAANTPESPGCLISFPAKTAHDKTGISYSGDVAPILEQHCVSCHYEGGIAPWAMTDAKMVQGWSRMMREVLLTQRMPPGRIDPHVGVAIANAADITPAQMQTLVHWIDAGAPVAETEPDPLQAIEPGKSRYALGEPDLLYKVAAQEIPATGILDYRYIPLQLNLDRDVWVKAIEFVPGDPEVLHHVIAYLSETADKSVRGQRNRFELGNSVAGFAPGRQPDQFRDNSGRLIRKGSNLLLQMHYTTTGRATVDETEVAIYLHDEPPRYIMSGGVAGQRRFLIPAHAREHPLQGEQQIERDAYLYSVTPHMHYRGKYMQYHVEFPDGSRQDVISVPNYDFNWQFRYQLKEPLFMPAGSRLVVTGAMDNSDRNPFNPDPSRPVTFGLQTKHEMFFGFYTLRYVGDTPESLLAGGQADKDVAGL